MLSVVIPTLDPGPALAAALDALAEAGAAGLELDIVLADGGSRDGAAAAVARQGARLVESPRGRGQQLAAGARAARGDWLLFLHADTVLAPGWAGAAKRYIDKPENRERAAAFRFALDDRRWEARLLERIVAWRCRLLALPYGDQGLLIGRAFHDALGGVRPIPLMEDVDLVRRIGRRRLDMLTVAAVTSAERYRRGGYLARPLRNLACVSLFFLGLPPRLILRLYG